MIEYTVKVNDDGTKYWYLNGKLHRMTKLEELKAAYDAARVAAYDAYDARDAADAAWEAADAAYDAELKKHKEKQND